MYPLPEGGGKGGMAGIPVVVAPLTRLSCWE